MKVMTILGTRPEIIRLSLTIKKLDRYCKHIFVHTGQNYEESLHEIFFRELGIRSPDYYLGVKGETFGEQLGKILIESEKAILRERPDEVLILGDTNSGLASIVAKRLGVPVYHMEAGNRCFDDRVPEEINRRVIDHSSSVLMPYTHRSKENLLREGIERERIYVIGNPIYEVISYYRKEIEKSEIVKNLGLTERGYLLVTMHRAENVDIPERLRSLVKALELLAERYKRPIVCSLHPRTRSKMDRFGVLTENPDIRFLVPLGFLDFIALEKKAFCVLTDSGTVQEECCIFNVPNITIRDVTERPETIECGSNMLTGVEPEGIARAVGIVSSEVYQWTVPPEYVEPDVSTRVIKILLGYTREEGL